MKKVLTAIIIVSHGPAGPALAAGNEKPVNVNAKLTMSQCVQNGVTGNNYAGRVLSHEAAVAWCRANLQKLRSGQRP